MNAQELYLQDGRSAGVWFCEKCRISNLQFASRVFEAITETAKMRGVRGDGGWQFNFTILL